MITSWSELVRRALRRAHPDAMTRAELQAAIGLQDSDTMSGILRDLADRGCIVRVSRGRYAALPVDVDSLPQLDALAVLAGDPDRIWSATEVGEALGISPYCAGRLLTKATRRGFAQRCHTRQDAFCRYRIVELP